MIAGKSSPQRGVGMPDRPGHAESSPRGQQSPLSECFIQYLSLFSMETVETSCIQFKFSENLVIFSEAGLPNAAERRRADVRAEGGCMFHWGSG